MKKKHIYILLFSVFFTISAFIIYRLNKNVKHPQTYALKERNPKLQTAEWDDVKTAWKKYATICETYPEDIKNRLAISMLFIQESRVTAEHEYYDEAAMHYVNQVLKLQPQNFDALILKSLIELSRHQFHEGLNTALTAQKINPYNAFVYGLLVDGYLETGNYEMAVENADKMVSIRPDIRSYSRISYLREKYGDYKGAIEAMKMAVAAGVTGDETTEWSRVQLGKLYEKTGEMAKAENEYNLSLSFRANYPYALAGLGSLATRRCDYKTARDYYERALELVDDHAIEEQLASLSAMDCK